MITQITKKTASQIFTYEFAPRKQVNIVVEVTKSDDLTEGGVSIRGAIPGGLSKGTIDEFCATLMEAANQIQPMLDNLV